MSDQYQVVTNETRQRVLFEGTEDDAKAYVEANFPRTHIEPGTNYGDDGAPADVSIKSPAGKMTQFKGGKWGSDKADLHDGDDNDDAEEGTNSERVAPARKTVAKKAAAKTSTRKR